MKKLCFIILFIFITVLIFSCSFSGESPNIVSVSISDGQRITVADTLEEITITFSKSMNRYITEKNISILGYYGTVHFEWSDSNSTVSLILEEPFEVGYAYTLEIASGCESTDGYDLGEDDRYNFYTYANESEFTVVSTSPGDGETITTLDGVEIVVEFSQPVRHTTIYDKVSIQPPLEFNYSFSAGRKTLHLDILQHLDSNQNFTVRIDKELGALDGKALKEDRSFSFNTVESTQAFIVQDASMVDAPGSSTVGSIQFENSTYPDVITGVEKQMELQVRFNTGFYLNTIENAISITPLIDYSLEKGDSNALRVIFEEPMTPEETYRAALNRSTSNIYGVTLDRDYAFEWTVNGVNSLLIRPLKISILSPEANDEDTGAQNTVIFDENVIDHNRAMPYRFISDDA
ncbi:MAG: Ig-like domain-containing protein, partial [Spirochaetes bacterium]|nr:Ig-like domain-containing protein [Spirochaetota bacterium]